MADIEYKNSLMANRQLTENILKQHTTLITNREAGKAINSAISLSNAKRYETLQTQLMKDLPPFISEMIQQAFRSLTQQDCSLRLQYHRSSSEKGCLLFL